MATHEISSADIYLYVFNGISGLIEQALVLYASSNNVVEVIPFDGQNVVGQSGGGVLVHDLLKFVRRMDEAEFETVLQRGGLGLASHARELYSRQPKQYTTLD